LSSPFGPTTSTPSALACARIDSPIPADLSHSSWSRLHRVRYDHAFPPKLISACRPDSDQRLIRQSYPFPSPALFRKLGEGFRKAVASYAAEHHIPVVRFGKDDVGGKLDVMRTTWIGRPGPDAAGWPRSGWRRNFSGRTVSNAARRNRFHQQ
jgi:hypothetical protein